MNQESLRYETFLKHQWPASSCMKPAELAAAGFYYTGEGDKVACFSCKRCLNNWQIGDVPRQEHRKFNPNCPFLNGKDQRNIPLSPLDVDSFPFSNGSVTAQFSNEIPVRRLETPESGRLISPHELVKRNKPGDDVFCSCKHKQFVTEEDRLFTFKYWQKEGKPRPSLLASAGFFSSGIEDEVICFYCDGHLRNWQPSDEPWVEHARNFPRCEWIFQQKGPYFIESVLRK